MKWEHKAIPIETEVTGDGFEAAANGSSLVLALDVAGLDGWELVSVTEEFAYLKRPLPEPEDQGVTRDEFATRFALDPEFRQAVLKIMEEHEKEKAVEAWHAITMSRT